MNALTPLARIDDMLPDLFRGWPRALRPSLGLQSEMRIDVNETDHDYLVQAEIPGAKKEDVRISVDGKHVAIAADFRKEVEEKTKGRALLKETFRGSISRGFSLGTEVDETKASATLEDGVLRLTLPKKVGGSSHTVPIR